VYQAPVLFVVGYCYRKLNKYKTTFVVYATEKYLSNLLAAVKVYIILI
jgi:hypothetical protein